MENESGTALDTRNDPGEFNALQAIITALQPLPADTRRRILDAAATFLSIGYTAISDARQTGTPAHSRTAPNFSESTELSPKLFVLEKQPRTDVERVACLAYYLTHYRDTPHFKTLDLSKLNTESAQPKFSNAANATNNAVKMGYLVSSTKGNKQLSAAGEQFVRALPERDAARAAMVSTRPRRRKKRGPASEGSKGES